MSEPLSPPECRGTNNNKTVSPPSLSLKLSPKLVQRGSLVKLPAFKEEQEEEEELEYAEDDERSEEDMSSDDGSRRRDSPEYAQRHTRGRGRGSGTGSSSGGSGVAKQLRYRAPRSPPMMRQSMPNIRTLRALADDAYPNGQPQYRPRSSSFGTLSEVRNRMDLNGGMPTHNNVTAYENSASAGVKTGTSSSSSTSSSYNHRGYRRRSSARTFSSFGSLGSLEESADEDEAEREFFSDSSTNRDGADSSSNNYGSSSYSFRRHSFNGSHTSSYPSIGRNSPILRRAQSDQKLGQEPLWIMQTRLKRQAKLSRRSSLIKVETASDLSGDESSHALTPPTSPPSRRSLQRQNSDTIKENEFPISRSSTE